MRKYFDELEKQPIEITERDQLIYSLCKPERLIEMVYKFVVYDAGVKKLPRYQQYFGVKKTLQRVKNIEGGKRQGGVIWHTQGSGKSLTMARSVNVARRISGIRARPINPIQRT